MSKGIILAAGNQKRFNSKKYKSLVEFNGKTLLEYNIENMRCFVEKIYVVISNKMNAKQFEKIIKNYKNVNLIKIKSGYGCGHAVLKALDKIFFTKNDNFYLIWGDSFQDKKVYKKIYNLNNFITVPVYYTENPYVQFVVNDKNIKNVKFSKYNEVINKYGFQDLSIFKFNGKIIYDLLKNVDYRNNELLFLDLFNTYNIGKIVVFNNFKKNSFNTIEEYKEIFN